MLTLQQTDDNSDNCQFVKNSDQRNRDGDKLGDVCDNCPEKRNDNQNDADKDGVGNVCDNCRFVPNPNQEIITDTTRCTTKPAYMMDYYDEDDDEENMDDKQGLAAEIMEKLLEMYYSQ